MAYTLTELGEKHFTDIMFGKKVAENLVLRLYTNDYTPLKTSVAGSFTEATGNGYAAITLTPTDWTVSTVAGVTNAVMAQKEFTFTGALGTLYGYYLTNTAGEPVLAERFNPLGEIVEAGQKCRITITSETN